MLKFTAQQIADYLKGTVEGNPDIQLTDIGKIEEGSAEQLTFLSNMNYEPHVYTTKCGAVLVSKDFIPTKPVTATLIRVEDAYSALAQLLKLREEAMRPEPGISHLAFVDPSAEIGKDVYIAPFAVVQKNAKIGDRTMVMEGAFVGQNARVGEGCILYQHVTVCSDSIIGPKCILHSGAVIGADGFGFAPTAEGYDKIPQNGNVVLEDNVEVGANTCIDRAVIGSTIIRKGAKLDNLVQIAHNSEVGEHTVMAAQSGIAGSVKIGRWNRMGGQVGIAGHLTTADNVTFAAQSGVLSSIKTEGITVFGTPSQPHMRAMKAAAIYSRLPELSREIDALRKEIESLKAALAEK
ncbi:UDP-3-O-acylglucosamine N-acyltransferase [Porphyromonas cangingivalis]|uniref:UDP-3-O-(3-hydroxymyristoyl)glucosamine N-acyltransferase n=1 Tax=Porphyromonas cangingivalis TaxID=36874 RepID=UPI000D891F33|nr:UDP-3-O-(3-hydroxymyristoyl)glucosamine N-acyltransferase [Porphyromonas cangingivalis]SPY35041.1 UDP-3-O-acylglucosamine N-acyltransferase [Porphyromonas cangingivalis]